MDTGSFYDFRHREAMPSPENRNLLIRSLEENIPEPIEVKSAVVKLQNTTETPRPYSMYAQIEVDEGQDLCHGYVHDHADLQLGVFQSPMEPWWARTVVIEDDPAQGTALSDQTVPTNTARRLNLMYVKYDTSGTAGTRQFTLSYQRETNSEKIGEITWPGTVTTNATERLSGGIGHGDNDQDDQALPEVVLKDGDILSPNVANFDPGETGDDAVARYQFTEWLANGLA